MTPAFLAADNTGTDGFLLVVVDPRLDRVYITLPTVQRPFTCHLQLGTSHSPGLALLAMLATSRSHLPLHVLH
jgi:hypothetical protein